MKKHKKLFIIIPILCVCIIFLIWLFLNYSVFDNVDADYKNTPGYEEYISDRDSGYSYAPYFGTEDVMYESEEARNYYYANSRRVGNYLITDYEDGVCINRYYGKLFKTINIPEKLDGKPVVKIGGMLYDRPFMEEIWYYEKSPFLGKGSIILNIPSTVKYISYSVFITPSGMLSDEDMKNMFCIAKINVDKDNPYYCSEDGVLYTKDMKSLLHLSFENDNFVKDGEVVLPDSVENFTSPDGFSFYDVVSVSFNKNIKKIDTFIYDETGTDAEGNYSDTGFGLIIKGYKGTVAEEWAKKYHAEFIPLD